MPKTHRSNPLLDHVEALLPLIRRDAAVAEAQGRLTDSVLQNLFDLGLFRLFVSERYQGMSVDLPTALRVFERVASADGATGWLVMIGAGGGLFSGFLPEKAARALFESKYAVIAGSGMPCGMARPNADTAPDGFEVSGRWPYASGAHHASTFTANCKLAGDEDRIVSIAVPASAVTIHDTWSTLGLNATGSHDFSIDPMPLDASMTFSLSEPPVLNEPIYHCPLETLAHLSFASVALGLSQLALSAFEAHCQQAIAPNAAPNQNKQTQIIKGRDQIKQARNTVYPQAERIWQSLTGEGTVSKAQQEATRQTCLELVQTCLQNADALKAQAGMMAIKTDSEFGRAWRDLHTLAQHALLAPEPVR
ncbi:MAG: acyl-CoA dehydrogenase family protein [Hydrogenovibrio sp.]|uniref:acyl-CoA dehydrogenase family protein n=1 Tax=Hydrogenovibrio sp. TaxID=2065821 RepID=UPI00286FDFF3|nr:acyl-CoA dehydrogenase family protein [Hydrogenovibrio sp.]MDR9498335.1 acyl-CoA dehydrogenase family protein [Hydrogenovibrio sp.]